MIAKENHLGKYVIQTKMVNESLEPEYVNPLPAGFPRYQIDGIIRVIENDHLTIESENEYYLLKDNSGSDVNFEIGKRYSFSAVWLDKTKSGKGIIMIADEESTIECS